MLRRKLEKQGAIFQSTMDTEVLLHLVAKSPRADLDVHARWTRRRSPAASRARSVRPTAGVTGKVLIVEAEHHADFEKGIRNIAGVTLTHPDRVYWADAGVSKRDLAEFYQAVWTWMRPHVAGRPIALLRCPEGVDGECFFQKHASAGIATERLHQVSEKDDKIISIDDLDGLMALVQAGVLEIHTRGSTIDDRERARMALTYTLSLPITAAVSPGDDRLLKLAVELALQFTPIANDVRQALAQEMQGVQPIFRNG